MNQLSIHSPLNASVYFTAETSSTMDDAQRLVRNGAPSGTVVVTDYQHTGRGRRAGRVWLTPPRESLMFTVALEQPAEPVTRSLVMAAAVLRLLEQEAGLAALVKWPNDILVGGRKICGILADHDGRWLYLGVGLNLLQRRFPPEIAGQATSVALEREQNPLTQREWAGYRNELLRALLSGYLDCRHSWHEVLSSHLWMQGEEVRIVLPGEGDVRYGRIVRLETDGRLAIDDGTIHSLAAGEVSLCGKAHDE